VGQLPVFYNRKPYVHESPYITGEYSPLFPFGFGLSYTSFAYSNLRLSADKITMGQSVKVTVEVTNTGDREGEEVVQLYIRDLVSSVTRPVQELKDFRRITLAKGMSKKVEFEIAPDKLQFYNLDMQRVVEPGEFEIQLGRSSIDYLSAKFEVIK
jgi:beta-glucosidase